MQPLGYLVEERPERLGNPFGDRPQRARTSSALLEDLIDLAGVPRIESRGEGWLADQGDEPVRGLAPGGRDVAASYKDHAPGGDHSAQLRDDTPPLRNQMQEVANHPPAKGVVGEGKPRGVAAHE